MLVYVPYSTVHITDSTFKVWPWFCEAGLDILSRRRTILFNGWGNKFRHYLGHFKKQASSFCAAVHDRQQDTVQVKRPWTWSISSWEENNYSYQIKFSPKKLLPTSCFWSPVITSCYAKLSTLSFSLLF